MESKPKLINEDVKQLAEAVDNSLTHVSKDMVVLKSLVDNLKKEIISMKTNYEVKIEIVKKELSSVKSNIVLLKNKVNKIEKVNKNNPIKTNETVTKRKDDVEKLSSELNAVNIKIDNIQNKLKL